MNQSSRSLIYFSTTVLVCMYASKLLSQELPSIETDRPDQTECPHIVPAKHFQLESGFNYEYVNKDEQNYIYPTALWKYGVNDHFELRLITESVSNRSNKINKAGIMPVEIGFKVKITEEKGILPKTSLIGHISIPHISSKNFRTTYYAPNFRFTMLHTLSNKLTLSYNLGAEWDGEHPEPIFIYTLAPAYSFTDRLGAYIELYGFAPQLNRANHRTDGGIIYLVKNNIQLDVSGGFRITDNAPQYYGALGLSIRLPR